VTNHLTQNIAAIPFLWVLPLGLYLLSFILCFGPKSWQWEKAFLPLVALAIAAMASALSSKFEYSELQVLVPLFSAGLFICCVLCHGELARTKPEPRYLTSFYLMISIGGALGGVFVGLFAPRYFSDYYELPIAIAACALVAWLALCQDESRRWWRPTWSVLGLIIVGLFFCLADDIQRKSSRSRLVTRSFYGVLRVNEWGDATTADGKRSLVHGTILHGEQYLKPKLTMQPTTYYGRTTGVGLTIRESQRRKAARIGVIGLGTGTLASYGRQGDVYRFYEINPLVQQPKQNYDVLVVDAFSSDAIPVHLLTREAFKVFFRHLKNSGVLAVHVSNLYLDLDPVVAGVVQSLGKQAMLVSNDKDEANDIAASNWVLVTDRRSFFKDPLMKQVSIPIKIQRDLRVWTDDYSNLYQILRQ
jgi:hypothetical protein